MEIAVVVGTRPELVKMAPVIRALRLRGSCNLRLIHTGQHYDQSMSGTFFGELDLPPPDANLEVGSCTPLQQVARTMERLESQLEKYQPDFVLAEGDTNSVVATALSASKLDIRFGHVEAGLRCFDQRMPEEINRILADKCAQYCFAPTPRALLNLAFEGIPLSWIHMTGNTVVDACIQHLDIAEKRSGIRDRLCINPGIGPYILVTLHRQENTDDAGRLRAFVKMLSLLDNFRVVFPVHPRTRSALEREGLWKALSSKKHVTVIEPLAYLDFLFLEAHAFAILTDSGGVQEEAMSLKVPCIILRPRTERPEGVRLGLSRVTDMDIIGVEKAIAYYSDEEVKRRLVDIKNPYGDGKAGERIADICTDEASSTNRPRFLPLAAGSPDYQLASLDGSDCRYDEVLCYFDPEGNAAQNPPPLNGSLGWKALIRN